MEFATTNLSGAADESGAEALVKALEASRQSADALSFVSIHSVRRQPEDVENAVLGRFRLGSRAFKLKAPIDWSEGPYEESDAGAFFLNSFVFADPVLASPDCDRALPELIRVFLDWLESNPRGENPEHRYSWHDHAAAGRLVYLAYVLREGVLRGATDSSAAARVATGVLDHVDYLIAEENYAATYNHGLFADAALAIAARALHVYRPAHRWLEVASARFSRVLEMTVDPVDALHLEHSPYYHWIIHGAISRFAAGGIFEGLDLRGLARRMEESGAWLVAPDGTLPPFGDTPWGAEPPVSVKRAAAQTTGVRVFEQAGYAAVREGGSCLLVTAAHHATAHKHADDGSFCLFEGGRPLVIDSGDPGHDYGTPLRVHGTSPSAHAAVTVGGHDWIGDPPSGSGVIGAARHGDRHAILVEAPNANPENGVARRALVYEPGSFLLCVDLAEAGEEQVVRRYLPLAVDLEVIVGVGGELTFARDGEEVAWLVALADPSTRPEGIEVVRGQEHPGLGGVYFPRMGSAAARSTVVFSSVGGAPRAFALDLRGRPDLAPSLSTSVSGDELSVKVSGLGDETMALRLCPDAIDFRCFAGRPRSDASEPAG